MKCRAGDQIQQPALESIVDKEIDAARLLVGTVRREAPARVEMAEHAFRLGHVDGARAWIEHNPAGVALAECGKADRHFGDDDLLARFLLARQHLQLFGAWVTAMVRAPGSSTIRLV